MSSDPFQPQDAPDAFQPEKQGMSAGAKLAVILGIVFLVLILLCCGGVVLFGVFGARYMGEATSHDPQVVRRLTDRIASIDIPEELEPVQSLDMKVPFTDTQMMTWVVYADPSQRSVLVLAEFGEALAGQNQAQLKTQMEQSLRGQGLAQQENVNFTERTERQIEVRGEPVAFFFSKGEDAETGDKKIQVTGTFEGPGGVVMLMVMADEESLGEDEIVTMIESIE